MPHAGVNLLAPEIEPMQALIEENGGRMIILRDHIPVRVASFTDPAGNRFELR